MVLRQYGRVVSAAVDPIEKKPLYHFLPGLPILSIAASGCSLHCGFCQNWSLSQGAGGRAVEMSPAEVVAEAQRCDSTGIAYTYSEPLVWYEFVRDTGRLAHAAGLKNVIVTNGYLNREPLRELLPLIDAANIDLKSMDEDFYRKICKGKLQPILDAIALCHETGVHLEVTNLVIPGHNDDEEQIGRLVSFVADLSPNIPLHFSAYHPAYKFTAPPTDPGRLLEAARLARRQLRYVFLGNVLLDEGTDTICPDCGAVAIERSGYHAVNHLTAAGGCPRCGRPLPVVVG